jgi:TonB family protein
VIADAFGSARSGAPSARAPAAVIPAAFDSAIAAPQAHRLDPAPSVIANAVRIVAKPKPQYTEEARRLRIEGEVWLDVLFGADGAVRVRGVVRSLGHGLDEAAIAAAREIRFHPANDGHADVDQIATIRVQFLLAD